MLHPQVVRQLSPSTQLSDPATLGLDPDRIEQLYRVVESHIYENRYPGAQVALARHGKLAAFRTFGKARLEPNSEDATDTTLWLIYSQTKVIIAAAVWILVDRGAVSFADRVADHIPEFSRAGKGEITLFQLLSHQAGFPNATVSSEAWENHAMLRKLVCDFELEWAPGTKLHYHAKSAYWVSAVLIEAVTGQDFRDFIRSELLGPLGLSDIYVGVPATVQGRCAEMHMTEGDRIVPMPEENSAAYRAAGIPSGGGHATAAAMVAFYQMIIAGGTLNGTRVLSPCTIQYATRNHTGERVDEYQNFSRPMHRGLGPHLRGNTPNILGLGTIAPPAAFGHGGIGSSYSWADPNSGLSFSYLTNCRILGRWNEQRLDYIANLAYAALVEP